MPRCPDAALAPDDWAAQAGVPALDPWRDAEAVPLFHLLRDRLDGLNALRVFGIVTLGQFEHARELALDLPVDKEICGRWVAVPRRPAPGWGAGAAVTRPVPARLLAESEAVSDTFVEPVIQLNDELGGDARALIDALRDGRVSRFRDNKTDQLESELAAAVTWMKSRRPPTPN